MFHDFSPSSFCCNLLQFYHSHSHFLKMKVTQDSKAHTSLLFRKIILNLKPFFSRRYESSTKGTFEGFIEVWFMGDFVGDEVKNCRKMYVIGLRCEIEACHCLLSKSTWFKLFQRSGAKICVKHQMSFLGVLEG